MRPGRKTAPPVTSWGGLILEANEREPRIVGDVRMWMKRRESSTEKSTITLGERGQAGQNQSDDNGRKPAAPAHAERIASGPKRFMNAASSLKSGRRILTGARRSLPVRPLFVVAVVFEQFRVRLKVELQPGRPWMGERLRIVERHAKLQVAEIEAAKSLAGAQRLRVRHP